VVSNVCGYGGLCSSGAGLVADSGRRGRMKSMDPRLREDDRGGLGMCFGIGPAHLHLEGGLFSWMNGDSMF